MGQYSSPGTELNAHGKAPAASSRLTVILTAAVAALGGALFGFDTSVISGAMLFLRTDFHLSDVQLEFAVGIALAGALVGAALAGYCTDRWGRRWMLLVTALGFGLFSVLSGLAVGLVSFSVARFFVGACIGIASLTVPLYIAEMAPARIRGALVSLNQLAITRGHRRGLLRGLRLGGFRKLALDVRERGVSRRRPADRHDFSAGKSALAGAQRISRTGAGEFPPPGPGRGSGSGVGGSGRRLARGAGGVWHSACSRDFAWRY